MNRVFFSVGAIMAGIAVAAGAYGAHGEPTLNPDQVRWIAKAARYQMYHGLALICVSFAISHWRDKARLFKIAGWLFLIGIIFFSGSLYLMAFTGVNLGYITPVGGISFMGGWFIMAAARLLKK